MVGFDSMVFQMWCTMVCDMGVDLVVVQTVVLQTVMDFQTVVFLQTMVFFQTMVGDDFLMMTVH